MNKVLLLCLVSFSSLFSQADFWTHHSLNTPVRQLVNYGDSILIAVRDIDILKSTDMGLSWDTLYTTPYPCLVWTRLDLFQRRIINGQVYMIIRQRNESSGCTSVPVSISTNSGQNWQNLNLPNGYFGDIDITSNGTLVLVSDTTYYSTNRGSSWNYLNTPNDGSLKQKIEVDTDDNLYVVREHKYWYEPAWIWFRSEYLYKSTDFGQNWQFLFNSTSDPTAEFVTLFHTENGVLIVSDVSPKTWYVKGNLIDDFPIHITTSTVILDSKFFFATAYQGIRYSSNFGENWMNQNTGLTDLGCYSIIKDTLGYLYVSTGNGIFKSTSSAYLTSIDLDEGKIENFDLSNSYPNPFNPSTTIEYQIPKTSKIRISIFNLLGEEIAVLINEEKTQGNYKVVFNGANLTSGVYFYKMQTKEYTSTKKFILLK